MPGDSEHPVTLGDLRVVDEETRAAGIGLLRPATVADLVSALRAEGVLAWWCETHGAAGERDGTCDVAKMVEMQMGWPKRCLLREHLIVDVAYFAEAQPFPPAGGVS